MAFTSINSSNIQVGDPVTKDLWDLIKSNFDDHESRLTSLSGGSGVVTFFNDDIIINNPNDKIYVEVFQDCIITEAAIQLFTKAPATTGSITIDIKKNTSTNPTGFTSIFSTLPTINIATATDYQRSIGTINPAAQSVTTGIILRFEITSMPVGLQKIRFVLKGAF